MRGLVVARWRQVWCTGLAALCLALGGCRTLIGPEPGEQSAEDAKPWNQPAGWEGQVLGVPY